MLGLSDVIKDVKDYNAKKNKHNKKLPLRSQVLIIEYYYGLNKSITDIVKLTGLYYIAAESIIKKYKTPFDVERVIIVKQSKINYNENTEK